MTGLTDAASLWRGPLSDAERVAALRLIRTETIGPVTFHGLIARFGSAGAALEAVPDLARRGGRRKPLRILPRGEAEAELEALEAAEVALVAPGETGYPPLLAHIDSAPPLVTVRGALHLADRPMISIVGARNASGLGQRFAEDMARALGGAGFLIASGLARGIDTAAHRAALGTGTAAVLAGGLDHVYPAENAELHDEIGRRGLLCSEMPLGFAPTAQHFPRRNRLIAGMALGVLVVEASLRSGSLITARLAAEQGREVFAVPGSPLDPRARGANQLLRQGATLVETLDDMLAVLRPLMERPLTEPGPPEWVQRAGLPPDDGTLEASRARLTELLSPHPIGIDELIRRCDQPAAAILTALLELELAGRLIRHAGGRVALDPQAE